MTSLDDLVGRPCWVGVDLSSVEDLTAVVAVFPDGTGDSRRYDAVVAHVVDLAERYAVQEVAIDRWNSTSVTTALQRENITVATFGQGFASMAAPVRELKRAILDRIAIGCRHPLA